MRILHIEDEPWDSGIAHYALTLALEQKRRGHDVRFWAREGPVLKAAKRMSLDAAALPPFWELRKAAAAFAPEVVNAHTGSAQTRALAAVAGTGAPVVRTRGDARLPRANFLTTLSATGVRAFIAANSALYEALRAAFPDATVRLVAQGVPGPDETPALPNEPVAGVLARFDPVKGHGVVLDAALALKSSIPGLRVRCAGEGALLDRIRWQLGPAGLGSVVDLPGKVADIWAFAASCRVGVVASTGSEAVSRAALEWMAAGRPVIATTVGGLPDLVAHGETGLLIPPGDPKALAEALAWVFAEPRRAEEMGRAARARWSELFSPAPFYEQTMKVYDEATRPPR